MVLRTRTFRVLIADDSPFAIAYLENRLSGQSEIAIDVSSVSKARDVLYTVEQYSPDLLLLDVKFEGERLDGIALCREIRARGYKVPIIFMTVSDFSDDRLVERYLAGQAERIIVKREELLLMQRHASSSLMPAMTAPQDTYLWPRKGRDFAELWTEVKKMALGSPGPGAAPAQEFEPVIGLDLEITPQGVRAGEIRVLRQRRWRTISIKGSQQRILAALLASDTGIRAESEPGVHREELKKLAGLGSLASLQTQISKLRSKLSQDGQARYLDKPRQAHVRSTGNGEYYRFMRNPVDEN